jgi:hypothetical protein
VSSRPVGPVGLNGPGRALARTNSRAVYKYIYLTELIIYNNILFTYIKQQNIYVLILYMFGRVFSIYIL